MAHPRSCQTTSAVITSTDAILESISDGVFTVDLAWRITSFNRAAEEITGISRKDAIGRLCSEVFRSNMCETDCALRRTMKNGKPIIGRSGYIVDGEGNRIPISLSTAVLSDSQGNVVGGAETFRDLSEIETLRHELEARFHVGEFVSRSPLMQRLFEVIPAIAVSPSTVLINGETGTGKELMARTIHGLSKRSKGPFVALNCGALPDTLLESELFGYKAGAFTGATKDKPGRFALASGGTLFLDEIGEISPALQVRLLRVLQERCFEPLGGTSPVTSDARIIVATNRDLSAMVKAGSFREDLYYRINVVRVELPPLRRRKEDLPLLVDQFIHKFNQLHHATVQGIAPEALSLLMAHDWPGNVRELENIIERAFVLCPHGMLQLAHLPDEITLHNNRISTVATLHDARSQLEAQTIRTALERNAYNRLAAARELGMHKTTLFRKIKQFGIDLPRTDGRSQRTH
ncbi:MAG: sigma-54 interaction domain-containing protein [Geobacter sp.]|jgi:PAS domain S-box-containing protein|uniref:sigma-54 interaction domain-containing protein n=1 Tax=Trichlorobacter sp. TaxID=2911007 RepID=UPI002A3584F9|nr:sigma 54-interacting transcriptional regulator [Trichlorobacter sp.]MDY0384454.1 sigma 54-interacting transcriptional regulator [Trichlorobacter sp.]